jgi:hypothetical protein
MTYKEWIDKTASVLRPRSTELKAVDAAFKAWELAKEKTTGARAEMAALQTALGRWIAAQTAKGQDWRKSVRNRNRAVELLMQELRMEPRAQGGLNNRGELMLTAPEIEAARILQEAYRANIRAMFQGRQLAMKTSEKIKAANDFRSSLGSLHENLGRAIRATPATSLTDTVRNSIGGDAFGFIESTVGPSFTDFLSSASPFVGTIKSASNAGMAWVSTVLGLLKRSSMRDAAGSFAPGDPAAAFAAILEIQSREIRENAAAAGIYTATAALKGGLTMVDGGALSGSAVAAVETLLIFLQKVMLLKRDWEEIAAANELLSRNAIDLTVFKACPLLGCYLVGNSDTSAIINMAVASYGQPGWKLEVERMAKAAQPVFEKSRQIIRVSRFEIPGLMSMKGAVVDREARTLGFKTGKIDGAIEDASKKVGSVIDSVVAKIDGKIDDINKAANAPVG